MARKGAFQKGICPNPAGRGAGLSGIGKSLRGQLKDEVVRATALLLLSPEDFAKKVSGKGQSTLAKLLGVAVQEFSRQPRKDKNGQLLEPNGVKDKKVHWEVIESFLDRSIGKPTLVKADENDENKTTFTLNYNFEKKELKDESEDEPENKSESRADQDTGDQEGI